MGTRNINRRHNGKVSYDTLQEAQRAASSLAARKLKQGDPIVTFLQAYGCQCGKYHFGKTRRIDWDLVTKVTSGANHGKQKPR